MNNFLKLFFILFLTSFSCSSQKAEVKAIAIIDILWDDEYTVVIASNKDDLENSINNRKVYKSIEEANQFVRSKNIISSKALQHLGAFIMKENRSTFPKIQEANPVFNFKVITDDKLVNCYYYSGEKDFLQRVNKLKKYLKDSPYKKEYEFIIQFIEKEVLGYK